MTSPFLRYVLIILAGAVLSACAPSLPISRASTASPSATAPAATQAPTETASPLPPTATPTPQVIGPENATGLVPLRDLAPQGSSVRALAFSPDSTLLVTATGANAADADLHLRLWSVADASLLAEGPRAPGIIWDVAFSPDGQVIASAEDDGAVRLWRASDLSPLGELRMSGPVNSLAFSPDGQILAAGAAEKTGGIVYLWNLAQAQVIRQWRADSISVPSLAFSPDGTRLASGATDRSVHVWHVPDGAPVVRLVQPGQGMSNVFSPDGQSLASGMCALSDARFTCLRGEAWIWSLPDGKVVHKLTGPDNWVNLVMFTPDGRLLLGAGRDGKIYLWSTEGGTLLSVLTDESEGVGSLAISPDGRTLAGGLPGGVVRIWAALAATGTGMP